MDILTDEDQSLSEIDQLVTAFYRVTTTILQHSEHEIEILRALSDRERLVKEQIKYETIKMTRGILDSCYYQVRGRSVADDLK